MRSLLELGRRVELEAEKCLVSLALLEVLRRVCRFYSLQLLFGSSLGREAWGAPNCLSYLGEGEGTASFCRLLRSIGPLLARICPSAT